MSDLRTILESVAGILESPETTLATTVQLGAVLRDELAEMDAQKKPKPVSYPKCPICRPTTPANPEGDPEP